MALGADPQFRGLQRDPVVELTETLSAVVAAVVAALLWRFTKPLVIGLVGGLLLWRGIVVVFVQVGIRG